MQIFVGKCSGMVELRYTGLEARRVLIQILKEIMHWFGSREGIVWSV
jgi:hypothetical protein